MSPVALRHGAVTETGQQIHMKKKTDKTYQKTKSSTLKSTLFNTILPQLKQQSPYFSIQAVRRILREQKLKIAGNTLLEYMSTAMSKGLVYDSGRGWYSSLTKPFVLNADPILKFIKNVEDKFPLLNFSCWSTQQINSFTHHMLAKFVTFIYVDQDALFSVRDWMRDEGFEVYANPGKAEIEKNFVVGKNTVVIRPGNIKETQKGSHIAPIEKILVDLIVETNRLFLMDETEAQEVVEKALQSGRILMSTLLLSAKRNRADISFLTKNPLITQK